jgi:hypothetical protein
VFADTSAALWVIALLLSDLLLQITPTAEPPLRDWPATSHLVGEARTWHMTWASDCGTGLAAGSVILDDKITTIPL